MPFPPKNSKNRPGSSVPKGRNYRGNRFGDLEEKGETKPDKEKGENPFAKKKGKAKKKVRPGLPKAAMGLANMMAMAGKK